MKKIIARHIMLGFFIAFVSNFSFAQELSVSEKADIETAYCTTQSSVCGTAPEPFTLLMDFVREMMNSIKTIGPAGDYLGQYVNPNWFQGNIFTAPKKSVVGKFARNVSQKLKFGLGTTAIFSSPVNVAGLKDMLGGVLLLSKNKVFLRDNKLVEQLETQLNDKKYELGLGGGWYVQVNPENREIMQGIVQKYINKGLLVTYSQVSPGVSYNNVTSLLTQALSSAKSFLYFGSTEQFDIMSRGTSDQGIFIGFDTGAMASVKREYDCARGPNYICSSESKKLKGAWTKLWKGLKLGSSSTKKTFKDAIANLGQLFTKGADQSKEFKAREADLLRSMYGTTKISKGTLADSLKKSWADIKKSGAEVGQQMSDLGSDVATFRTMPKNLKDAADSLPVLPTMPADSVMTTDISKMIDTYVYDVFASQKTDLDLVSMSEVRGVTPAFTVLGKQVSVLKNDILGGKDKKNSLMGSLGVACELQCGRGGLCR